MTAKRIQLDGKQYVIVSRAEYDRIADLARLAALPPLPAADRSGNFPAVAYARASIARGLVRARVQAGLTQRELARLSGVRVETLCRIETNKHTASTATIAKLDRALRRSGKPARRRGTRA